MGILARWKAARQYKLAQISWKDHQRFALIGDDDSQTTALLQVVKHCQLAVSGESMFGDPAVMLTNALLVCASRIGLKPEASTQLRAAAAMASKSWIPDFNNGSRRFKSEAAALQMLESLESERVIEAIRAVEPDHTIDATKPASLPSIEMAAKDMRPDYRTWHSDETSGNQPDDESETTPALGFPGIVASLLASVMADAGHEDHVPLEHAVTFAGVAAVMGMKLAEVERKVAIDTIAMVRLPEALRAIRSPLSWGAEWELLDVAASQGRDASLEMATNMLKKQSDLKTDGEPVDWLLSRLVAKIGSVLDDDDAIRKAHFFVQVFEACFDGIVFWLTFVPEKSPEQLMDASESRWKPQGGNIQETYSAAWGEYRRLHG